MSAIPPSSVWELIERESERGEVCSTPISTFSMGLTCARKNDDEVWDARWETMMTATTDAMAAML
jgi:hypothetical protein